MSTHDHVGEAERLEGSGRGSDRIIGFACTVALCLATGWPWQLLGRPVNAFRLQLWGAGACLALTAVLARRVRFSRSWADRCVGLVAVLSLSPLAMAGTLPGAAATLAFPLGLFAAAALWVAPSPLRAHCARMVFVLSPATVISLAGLPTGGECFLLFIGGYLLSLLPWHRLLPRRDEGEEATASALAGVVLPMVTVLFALFAFQVGHGKPGTILLMGGFARGTAAPGEDRLRDLLTATGHTVVASDDLLSRASLENRDCLVLRPPCRPFATSELAAVERFVDEGGGLLVIGAAMNHDSVLGIFNPVLERFGIRIGFDRISGDLEACRHVARRHPCLWRVPDLGFGHGASLRLRPPARALVCSGPSLFADRGDMRSAREAHRGNGRLDSGERLGDLVQIAVSSRGTGRVAATGDPSLFRGVRLADNAAFCHRLFAWLVRRRSSLPWHWPVAALSVIFFLFAWHSRPDSRQVLLAWCLSLPVAWHGAGLYNDLVLGSDPTRLLRRSVLVDGAHGNTSVPRLHGPVGDAHDLSALYSIFAALDLWPRTLRGPIGTEDLVGARLFVTVAPRRDFSAAERRALASFVRAGGALLVFQGPSRGGGADELLRDFDLRCGSEDLRLLDATGSATERGLPLSHPPDPIYIGVDAVTFPRPTSVRGGAAIANAAGVPVMARSVVGRGRIIVVGDHDLPTGSSLLPTTRPEAVERRRLLWNLVELLAKEDG